MVLNAGHPDGVGDQLGLDVQDLLAWVDLGQWQAGRDAPVGGLGRIQVGRVLAEGQAQHVCGQRSARIAVIVDAPLELDTVQPRRSVFETDHGHIALGLVPVAQRRRRRVPTGTARAPAKSCCRAVTFGFVSDARCGVRDGCGL
jgi:hypothetical protein